LEIISILICFPQTELDTQKAHSKA
jgi:hypothetical protein